jgi:hypothetical protein
MDCKYVIYMDCKYVIHMDCKYVIYMIVNTQGAKIWYTIIYILYTVHIWATFYYIDGLILVWEDRKM